MRKDNPYDQKYAGDQYYWGKEPSKMCDRVIELLRPRSDFRPRLLDLGCGEGRNAVYLAEHGFEVVGVDASLVGLTKMKRYADGASVQVETIHTDMVGYELEGVYDVIFSTGTLQYLPPEIRSHRFQNYKEHTSLEGIHAHSVLLAKPFTPGAPDAEENAFLFRSGELMSHYWDWEILYCGEEIFDCRSGGTPHKHAVNRMIARRPR